MERTSRGFQVYRRTRDRVGREVRVQESSIATEHAVWLIREDESGDPVTIHLDRAGALAVMDGLASFRANTDGIDDLPEPGL